MGSIHPPRTTSQNAQAGNGEIIAHGVLWVQVSQGLGDFFRHGPRGCDTARKPEVATDAGGVRIQWQEEMAGWYGRPDAQVETIRSSNHPAQVEVPPLARGTGGWIRQQMIDSPLVSRHTPSRVRSELFAQETNPFHEGCPDGLGTILCGQIEREERCLDRTKTPYDPLEEPEEHGQILRLLESIGIAFVGASPS